QPAGPSCIGTFSVPSVRPRTLTVARFASCSATPVTSAEGVPVRAAAKNKAASFSGVGYLARASSERPATTASALARAGPLHEISMNRARAIAFIRGGAGQEAPRALVVVAHSRGFFPLLPRKGRSLSQPRVVQPHEDETGGTRDDQQHP